MFKDDFFSRKISEVQAVYNCSIRPSDRPKITCAKDVFELLRNQWIDTIEHHESFGVLLLASDNSVLGINWISHGGLAGTIMDIRHVFQLAIVCQACNIIVVHNHPSGNKYPSHADEKITDKIKQAGLLLEIKLLDHVIFTSEKFFSFADDGRI